MANQNVCLISTVHDPEGKLAPFVREYLPTLENIYGEIRVNITQKTHLETWKALGEHGSIGKTAGDMASGRRRALRLGLETECEIFHHCDLDRILYWVAHEPVELHTRTALLSERSPFIIFQRSDTAFRTHPFLQRLTERIANWFYEDWYRDNYSLDFLSGSRIIPRDYAEKILEHSNTPSAAAQDFEWPIILGRDCVTHTTVSGLAYEHRFLGIEKPFTEEVKTRLRNLFEVWRLKSHVTR